MKLRFLLTIFVFSCCASHASEITNKKAADILLQCSAIYGYVSKISTKPEKIDNARKWYAIYFLAAQDLSSEQYVKSKFPTYLKKVENDAFKKPHEFTYFLQNETNHCIKLENLDPETEAAIWNMLKKEKTPNK